MSETSLKGRDYRTGKAIEVRTEQGLIGQILPLQGDPHLPLIAPGLVDLQVNGFGGLDFNHFPFSVGMVDQVTRLLWQQGVTTYMPTVITASDLAIEKRRGQAGRSLPHQPEGGSCRGGHSP
ncbi:hypothetical protein [Erwinia sp. E_sp_B01_9]|uniref:hypothetical protein n=1 Tax=Erwinia sp. E_sp_B01_9 TaxID=3039403 RepID=UPI003D9B91E0